MRASGSRPAAGVDGDSVLLRRAARPPANVSGREQSDERFRTPFELWESLQADVPKRDAAGVRCHRTPSVWGGDADEEESCSGESAHVCLHAVGSVEVDKVAGYPVERMAGGSERVAMDRRLCRDLLPA